MNEHHCELFDQLVKVNMGIHVDYTGKVIDLYWCDGQDDMDLNHLNFKHCPYCGVKL